MAKQTRLDIALSKNPIDLTEIAKLCNSGIAFHKYWNK